MVFQFLMNVHGMRMKFYFVFLNLYAIFLILQILFELKKQKTLANLSYMKQNMHKLAHSQLPSHCTQFISANLLKSSGKLF